MNIGSFLLPIQQRVASISQANIPHTSTAIQLINHSDLTLQSAIDILVNQFPNINESSYSIFTDKFIPHQGSIAKLPLHLMVDASIQKTKEYIVSSFIEVFTQIDENNPDLNDIKKLDDNNTPQNSGDVVKIHPAILLVMSAWYIEANQLEIAVAPQPTNYCNNNYMWMVLGGLSTSLVLIGGLWLLTKMRMCPINNNNNITIEEYQTQSVNNLKK